MWNLKHDTNELIYNRFTDRGNRLVVTREDGCGDEWIGSLGLAYVNYYK